MTTLNALTAALGPPPRAFKLGCLCAILVLILLQCGIIWGAVAWGQAHAGTDLKIPPGCYIHAVTTTPSNHTYNVTYSYHCP